MRNLGKQVLRKIQNLLVEIDKTDQTKKKRQSIKQNNKKGRQAQNINHQNHGVIGSNVSQKQNKENICSDRIQQLYLNHFVKEEKLLNKNLQLYEGEMKSLKSFRVKNKKSQFIIQRQGYKPIYERTKQVLQNKSKSIERIKCEMPKSKQKLEEEQIEQFNIKSKSKPNKYNKQEYQKKIRQYELRRLVRAQKKHHSKLAQLEEKNKLLLQKPQVSSTSNHWFEKRKLKKNLSSNVFQRFEQYSVEQKHQWGNYLEQLKQQLTPFRPRLTQASRQLARKNPSTRGLYDKMSRSHSCNILTKNQDLTFLERKQDSKRNQIDSISKRHQKSSTTANSSKLYNFNNSHHHLLSSRQLDSQRRLF